MGKERPEARLDGSYAEPIWPGRWFDADDGRLFKLDRDSRGRWFVEGGGVVTITERDRWYPAVIRGLDPEPKCGTADDYFAAILKAHDLLYEAGIPFVCSVGGWSLHERLKLVAALASERDAALERAEKAERERDEARKERDRFKGYASVANSRVKQLETKLAALRSAPPEREASASRPVLPEDVKLWAEWVLDRCSGRTGEMAAAVEVANWLLDAFTPPSSPPQEAEDTSEADPSAAFCGAFARLYVSVGHEAAKTQVGRLAALLAGEARP